MKTLLQTALLTSSLYLASTLPLPAQDPRTPISSVPFTISSPGSYYLTANLTASGNGGGITISADNVTLDLNGFAIIGGGSGNVTGVRVPASQKNILIRNGTVRGWTGGGIDAANASNSVIQGLRVSNNSASSSSSKVVGLLVGAGSAVKDCVVANNNNQVSGTLPAIGTRDNGIVTGCTASNNHGADGISVGNACLVIDCVARSNNVGIRVLSNCRVIGNVSDSNSAAGIVVSFSNGQTGNRIEGNSCTSNGNDGILIPNGSTNNLLIRNSARENNPNYNIAAGNRYGRIVDLTSSNTSAVFGNVAQSSLDLATTDPWANFAY